MLARGRLCSSGRGSKTPRGPRLPPASLNLSPRERGRRGGRPQGTPLRRPLRNRGDWPRRWRTSITRGGCEGAPHLNLLPRGEGARPPGPTHACPRAVVQRSPAGEGVGPRAATASPRPLSVSPSGREAGGVDARKGRPYGDLCVIRGLATRGGLGWGNGRFANRPYGRDGFPEFTNEVQHQIRVLPWDTDSSRLRNDARLPAYVPRAPRSGKSLQLWIARHRRWLGS